jgi:hypothetical protein
MSSDKSLVVLKDFQKSLVTFFDILADMFPKEADFIMIRIMVRDQVPIIEVMNFFISNILPEKDTIAKRSDSFFLGEKNVLFSIGPFKSNNFKKLWESDLDSEEKKLVWTWLDTFVYLTEKYMKLTRI